MPFTPAHPAIILPFLKNKYFSATGLIAGSISPDFEYFLKASVSGVRGHTILGMFYFDLPMAFLIAIAFHLLIKESLICNLPPILQRRVQSLRTLDFKEYLSMHYLVFIVSVLVGAGSHIFWDGFTHNGRFFVENLSIYKDTFIHFHGAKYPLWYALQHVSTIVGLTIISAYIILLPTNKSLIISTPKITYWMSLILLGGLFFIIRFTFFTAKFDLGNAVVTSISSLILALCVISPIRSFKPVPVQ